MGNDKQCTEEKLWLVYKYIGKGSTSPIFREMQIKTRMRYHFTLIWLVKTLKIWWSCGGNWPRVCKLISNSYGQQFRCHESGRRMYPTIWQFHSLLYSLESLPYMCTRDLQKDTHWAWSELWKTGCKINAHQ